MKRLLLLSLLLGFGQLLSAQQNIPLGRPQNRLDLGKDQGDGFELTIAYSEIQTIKNHNFTDLTLAGGCYDGEVGQPKLPVTQRLIEVPFGAEVVVNVLHSDVQEIALADYGIERIAPVQAPVSKDEVPEAVPLVIDEAAYAKDEYLGQELAHVEILGTMRGYHIAKLTVAPLRYNPVKNTIQMFNDITLEVSFLHPDLELTHEIKAKTYSPYFDFIRDRLLNGGVGRDYPDHPDLTRYPIKYVIVADRMFQGYLDPFIKWKTQKGFQVVLSYTDEVGITHAAIQAYLHGLYNNATSDDPAPSFILFVGDTQQIPGSIGQSSGKVTDLYYASVDGDYFPEMYYGRFSAQTVDQLLPQIEKTLYYEQYQFVDPSYLNKATLIAGWDDYWNAQIAQPTVVYGLENWFNENHGYSEVFPYFSPEDYAGCYEDEKISVSMINYTAHCSETVWGTPALNATTISKMHNQGFYPLAIGNCCESSQFAYGECVGESWVRADNKGAVCYIGSAPSTYWYEDAWWAMGSYHISQSNLGQAPLYSQTTMGSYDAMHENAYVSASGLVYCGNLAVTESCNQGWSDAAHYYWEAYNVLGDPSLVTYHTEGTVNAVSHGPTLFRGVSTFSLTAEPGSYVGLSKDGVLLGSGLVGESGELALQIQPVNEGGFADLVVTKPQRIPYITTLPVAMPGQPFLVVEAVEPEQLDYNEETALTVTVKNVGDQPVPANTTIDLSSQDDRMVVTAAQTSVGQEIPVGGTLVIPNAFRVMAGAEVSDQERFRMITLADCGDQVNADFYLTANKPVFAYEDYTWSDGFTPGGIFDVEVSFVNTGGCAAESAIGRISTTHPGLSFDQAEIPVGRIEAGEVATLNFTVYVAESVGEEEALEFEVSLEALGVSESHPIVIYNSCPMLLELRDTGGDGWNGASVKIIFEDGTSPMTFTLENGSQATYQVISRKGFMVRLLWNKGNHDEECSFTLSYENGDVIYESGPNLNGNLFLTTIDCAVQSTAVQEYAADNRIKVFPNPATDQLHVVSDVEITRCRLMNSFGTVVMDVPGQGRELQLPTQRLAAGIYVLLLTTSEGVETVSVVIR